MKKILLIFLCLPLIGFTQLSYNITIDSENKWDGNLFFLRGGEDPKKVMIIDDANNIVFDQQWGLKGNDFKVNYNNKLSYFDRSSKGWFIMDSLQNEIDSVYCQNGYTADNHDFIALSNGNYILFAYDLQPYAMDTVVQGGDPNASVEGLIIQELDANHNLVFEWKSWDHFHVTDCAELAPWTASSLPFIHANAIDIDFDEHLLLSSRNLDEITKINRLTGEIIWRFGGAKNEFTLINDYPFSKQHSIQSLGNNRYLLFDNGNNSSLYTETANFSRAVEYELDTILMTATKVWEFVHPDSLYAPSISSVQRLPNGNTLIDFGNLAATNNTGSVITEVDSNNEIVFQMEFDYGYNLYRAKKFNWNFYNNVPQKTYVPDDNFESYLEINNMGDGIMLNDSVLTLNISGVDSLDISSQNINSIIGIEDFSSLISLSCSNNLLTNANLSQNTNLVRLLCDNNNITSLNISENVLLGNIDCSDNLLDNIDVSQNSTLHRFVCSNNQLTNLNLTQNPNLNRLICNDNQLISLDLSNNSNLSRLNASNNQLVNLDVRNSNNTSINYFNTLNNTSLNCIDVDDPIWSTNNWIDIDSQHYFSANCNISWNCIDLACVEVADATGAYSSLANCEVECHTSSITNLNKLDKKLRKITNLFGQETPIRKNTTLFYLYDDATVEKKIIIE